MGVKSSLVYGVTVMLLMVATGTARTLQLRPKQHFNLALSDNTPPLVRVARSNHESPVRNTPDHEPLIRVARSPQGSGEHELEHSIHVESVSSSAANTARSGGFGSLLLVHTAIIMFMICF